MSFKDKYTEDKTKEPEKTEISSEAYVIADLLEQFIERLTRNK